MQWSRNEKSLGEHYFLGRATGKTRVCSFSEKKQFMEETVSEILPGSISNKHRVCSQAYAPLDVLCVSSSCICTHMHEVCSISGHMARHQASHLEEL